jgi:hypothetical protein
MPFGVPKLDDAGVWNGMPTGTQQKNIAYTTTDNSDGATARARYVLTLHDEYEKKTHQIIPN